MNFEPRGLIELWGSRRRDIQIGVAKHLPADSRFLFWLTIELGSNPFEPTIEFLLGEY